MSQQEEQIRSIIDKIYIELQDLNIYPSLIGGDAGIELFKIVYSIHFKKSFDEKTSNSIQDLAEKTLESLDYTYCNGKAGLYWFFSFLNQKRLITKSELKSICSDGNLLMYKSLLMISDGNYDLLYGGVGIAYYCLYTRKSETNRSYIQLFLNKLIDLISNDLGMIPAVNFSTFKSDRSKVNFGLAHGITSILKFSVEAYRIYKFEQARSLSINIINYLLRYKNNDGTNGFFPNMVGEKETDVSSRLAWCYGDLTICYVMYQAANLFSLPDIKQLCLEILISTSKRLDYSSTLIIDSGFCHGSIGVAHIYNKIWRLTRRKIFKNACDFWIQRSLELDPYHEGKGTRMKYHNLKKTYESDYSLLEGSAGFGLALISYLTGDFSWDYSLMLN